jgi:outer membrane autotransporter protein
MRTHLLATTVVAAALLAATSSTRAQTSWTGAISSDWFTPGNWTASVPNGATPALIDTVTPNATVVGTAGATASQLNVGFGGTGMLTIQSGGTVSSGIGIAIVGNAAGSQGTVTVTGAGSTLTFPSLFVGALGTGALTIAGGGTVSIGGILGNGVTAVGQSTQGTVTVTGAGSTLTSSGGIIVGAGVTGTGTLTIADGGTVSSSGPVQVATGAGGIGTLNIGAGDQTAPGTLNTASVVLGAAGTLNFNHTSTNYVFAPVISGNGSVNVLQGTTILTANSTYTGPTNVMGRNRVEGVNGTGGTLVVNGSIANSAVTVSSGGMLAGTGTVGPTTIASTGGTFAPGAPGNSPGTMTVAGNLAFQSGALYLVQVNPSTASSTNVTAGGSATLAGTVQAAFAPGSYVTHTYTIVSASGGRVGTFDSLSTTGLPAGFQVALSYSDTSAFLNLTAALEAPGETADERSVAHALDTAFNTGHALPPNLVPIFNLTGGDLDRALDEVDGEVATGAQQVAFQLMNQFLGVMLDPFVDGRAGVGGGGAIGFAPERAELPDDIALAYAKILKEPPKPQSFEQPWSVWGAGYGGSNRTTGDTLVVGSHDRSAATAGGAAGLDYRLAPGTVVGFALAGGGTSWGLAQGLGTGKSDAFQAGVYGTARLGAAYLAAALAYTDHWMSTDRFAFAGDHLAASFNAQSFGGRLESGYRFATIYGGLTPYAAIQWQAFHTPGYSENDLNGGGDALAFNARNATDTRSELGGRFDRLLLLNPAAALTLRARVAWAHDAVSDPTLTTEFQTLPGSNFIVSGATPAKNSALTSAGVELRLANGVTALAKFDGEFASHSSTYAGTGTVRYTW